MKKTTKTNVLKGFNDTKANAVKKANATMSTFKKSLPKAQDGIVAGPQTKMQSILSNYVNSQPAIPRPNRPSRTEMIQESVTQHYPWENTSIKEPRPPYLEPTDPLKKVEYNQKAIDNFKKQYPNGVPGSSVLKQKKGGSVKRKK
jgi:hypothetical protein